MAIRQRRVDASVVPPHERWRRVKTLHFRPRGRGKRVARALRALEAAVADYGLHPETARWVAEDTDLEDV